MWDWLGSLWDRALGSLADTASGLWQAGSWLGQNVLAPMLTNLGPVLSGAATALPYLMPPDKPRMPTTGTSFPGQEGAYQPLAAYPPIPTAPRRLVSPERRFLPPEMQVRGLYSGGVVTPEALAALGVDGENPYGYYGY